MNQKILNKNDEDSELVINEDESLDEERKKQKDADLLNSTSDED